MKALKQAVHDGWLRAVAGSAKMQVILIKEVKTEAKTEFKRLGWSYRAAASKLGVSYSYLCHVLNPRVAIKLVVVR